MKTYSLKLLLILITSLSLNQSQAEEPQYSTVVFANNATQNNNLLPFYPDIIPITKAKHTLGQHESLEARVLVIDALSEVLLETFQTTSKTVIENNQASNVKNY